MKYCAVCANFMRSFKHLRKIMYCDSLKVKTSYTVSKLVKLRFDGNISSSPLPCIIVKLKTESGDGIYHAI